MSGLDIDKVLVMSTSEFCFDRWAYLVLCGMYDWDEYVDGKIIYHKDYDKLSLNWYK